MKQLLFIGVSTLFLSCSKNNDSKQPIPSNQLKGHLFERFLMKSVTDGKDVHHSYFFFSVTQAESFTSYDRQRDYSSVDTIAYSVSGNKVTVGGKTGEITQGKITFPPNTTSVPGVSIDVIYTMVY